MKKNITIQDVANRAGVSKTTISRYLNGRYGNMSAQTKEKIKNIIEELDYRPSKQAQGLKLRKSSLIGLLVADIENLYSAHLIKSSQDALNKTGYQMVIMNSNNSVEEEQKALQKLIDQNVDGILLQPVTSNVAAFQMIEEAGIPMVLIDRTLVGSKWTTVQSNNFQVTKELTIHLLEKGYEKIVFVSEPIKKIHPRLERLEGVRVGAMAANVQVDLLELYDKGKGETIVDYVQKNALTKQKTAFFAANGTALQEIVLGLNRLHLQIPAECGVCGYDDWFLAELINPGITTIQQQPHRIGERSVVALLEELEAKQPLEKIEIPAQICFRYSL